jgi:hypothetical protein
MQSQVPCGAQQHRGVSVVPASMHFPGGLRTMLERVDFLDRQGVHIRPQPDRSRAAPSLEHADHTGFAQSALYAQAPFFE